MIFKSFLLGNLVCLYMKILNSVVVIGLYYGFLTTFSIGISSLFFLQAGVIEEREEGIENKISVTTGFITGQLMIFISIIYAPMYLALSRPHTITILVVPYLLFHFFWNNQKNFLDYRSTKNSIRNLTIQWIFLNNLIFQLFNYFILPSSILTRLINIYMFRCNNKMLFITSSFFGWLIGQILFMKWIGLVLVWIQQNNFIRSNRYIRFNKYLVSELRNWIARIFSILLFITCIYYLGRIPSPSLTNKLKKISKKEEISENGEETDREKKITSIFKDTSYSFFSEEKGGPDKINETEEIRVNINSKEQTKEKLHVKASWYKNKPVLKTSYVNENKNPELNSEILKKKTYKRSLWFEQPFVILIFDYKQWNRPLRYIKNNRFESAIRNEMSQYFFYTCQNDGKLKISFTYPPSLLTFFEMIQRRISLYTIEKVSYNELYNYWIYTNEQKKNKQSKEFINRIEALDKGYLFWNIVEKRTRLYTEIKTKEYLPKIYDPLINGPFRGTIKKRYLPSIINKMFIENSKENEMVYINKIHDIFLTDSQEFEHKIDNIFNQKLLSKGIVYFLTLINQLNKESIWNFNLKGLYLFLEQEKINSKDVSKFLKFVFDLIITDPNNHKRIINKSVGVKTISKKVPQWSYKLINELEQQEGENEGSMDHQIRSRKAKRIILFGRQKTTNTKDINYPDQTDEIALIRYSQQPDFRRDIIKGSMRNQRRKTVIWKLFQANLNSPLFFDRIDKFSFFYFEISKRIKLIFRNKVSINSKFQISSYTEKERKEMIKNKENKREEKVRIEIAEAWDAIPLAQIIRGYMLITQSILRKYILLPSLIIVKNIGRMLLFQFPEWSEDLKEWNREVHIKCTYNGVPLSETEFPKNWLMEGIQIKILFPFCLKPWHRSKFRSLHRDPITTKKQKDDFCFLTIWGMETELPFGSPRKGPSFFEPIFKKLEKKVQKLKNKCSLILRVLNEKIKFFLRISKELKSWFIKKILFLKRRIINLVKLNPIFRLKEVYKSSQTKKEKDSISNNQIIYNSSIKNGFMNWTKYSLTEKKMKELSDRTNKIRNQIEIITKDKKRIFITSKIKTSQSYNTKRGVESSKNFWKIVKRINARLIRKLHYFIKDFIEKIYINIYLCIINIPTLNAQLFIESTKKMIDKYIYNNQSNQERIDKRNQTTIRFISTLKKSIYNISNSNKSSQIFYDLSYLSQTYVFYKLSQIQVNNLDKLKYVFQYHGTSFFVKNKIKNYLGLQGIFCSNSKLKYKKVWKSKTKQWKNWLLRSHYQYDLSTIKWSRLVSQKWRNRIKQHCTFQNKNLNKWDFYNKDQLIYYKKQKDYEGISLSRKKDNFKKHYRYDLLSYKSINFEYINDSDIYRSPLQFQVKKKDNIYYNYNTHKGKLLNILESINNYLNNYLVEDGFMSMDPNMNRKYFDYQILYFCLKKKINIEDSININTKSNKNIKNESIIDKITNKNNKNLVYLKIHQKGDLYNQTKSFFNWMGMNEEIRNHYRLNIGLWFFSEFILLSNEYKIQPWIIPIQLLLFNFNENVKENINRKPKKNLFISSNAKKSFELENQNQEEKELSGRGNLGSDVYNQENLEALLSNGQKDLKKDFTKSNMKKLTQKNQYKNNTEEELNFFLKSYLLFQLKWNDLLNEKMINNIKSYCLLLRMINPKEITLVSIQKGEMNLDIMLTPKDLTLTELIKKGILIIEPVRLSVKNDSQFLMYQTVTISLVHKSKHQMNQRYQQKRYVEKQKMKNPILRDYKMFGNKNENYYNFHLLIPETILSPRCRREFKIQIYFDSKSRNNMDRNPIFNKKKNVKKCDCSLDENKYLDKNKSIKLKFFLWPNYRLEDLTCMNRYWFNTNNGTRLTLLRIHMYPQIKIR